MRHKKTALKELPVLPAFLLQYILSYLPPISFQQLVVWRQYALTSALNLPVPVNLKVSRVTYKQPATMTLLSLAAYLEVCPKFMTKKPAIADLVKFLSRATRLEAISIRGAMRLTAQGVCLLAGAINISAIKRLELSKLRLGIDGVSALFTVLPVINVLSHLDISGNIATPLGRRGFSQLSKYIANPNNSLTYLNIGDNSINHVSLVPITEALRRNNTITTLDISGNNLGCGALCLLHAINSARSVQRLIANRASIPSPDQVSFAIVVWIRYILRGSSLPLSVTAQDSIIYQSLSRKLFRGSHTIDLDLGMFDSSNYCMHLMPYLIIHNCNLRNLTLRGIDITDIDISELGSSLRQNKTLKNLSFIDCGINDSLIQSFSLSDGGLRGLSLESIDLAYNAISDYGIKFLGAVLQNNHTIKTLSLWHNPVTAFGARYLAGIMSGREGGCVYGLEHVGYPQFRRSFAGDSAPIRQRRWCGLLGCLLGKRSRLSAQTDGQKVSVDCFTGEYVSASAVSI